MIPKQLFGRTGHASTRIIFGSYALREAAQAEADRVLEQLLEYGVNHIDTAPMYGKAEQRIGRWMDRHRADFFLATKTRSRTYEGARANLRRSLDRLRVDKIDLWQMHGLTNPAGWEKAMGPGGALEALLEAREQGLVGRIRNLGEARIASAFAGPHRSPSVIAAKACRAGPLENGLLLRRVCIASVHRLVRSPILRMRPHDTDIPDREPMATPILVEQVL